MFTYEGMGRAAMIVNRISYIVGSEMEEGGLETLELIPQVT